MKDQREKIKIGRKEFGFETYQLGDVFAARATYLTQNDNECYVSAIAAS